MKGSSRGLLELTWHLPGITDENHIKLMNTGTPSTEGQTRNLPNSRESVVKHSDPAQEKRQEKWNNYIKMSFNMWQLLPISLGDEVGADEIEVLWVHWWFRTFDPSSRNGNPCVLWQWSIVRLKGRRFITWRGKANIRTLGCNIWIDICGKVIHMLERCNSLVVSAHRLLAPGRESRIWSINPLKNSQSKTLHFTHTVFLWVPDDSSSKHQILFCKDRAFWNENI
jgi:hypothetical protein